MDPYDEAAEIYAMSRLWPIPVGGKAHPISGATGYDGTVTPEKIAEWLHPDPVRRARAGRGASMSNAGLRHQLTLAIDVDDGYGAKSGVAQLAAWAAKVGLPPLPGTWSSTARGDGSPSRQYVYRIAEDVKFKTKPCNSVELCTWHHRYTVCAPSIHPDTGKVYRWYLPGPDGTPPGWGEPTDRYPTLQAFTALPEVWVNALRGGVVNADRDADTVALPELCATFPAGEPDGLVRHLMAKWQAEHVGHDELKNGLINALMLGRQGHTGVPALVQLLVGKFRDYARAERPHDPGEADRLVAFCATIAQQKPLPPPVRPGQVPTPHQFMAGMVAPAAEPEETGGRATDEEISYFLATYTRYANPARLARRLTWAKTDPAWKQGGHFRHLVEDALAGHYPAGHALRAIGDVHRHHQGTTDPRLILSLALGAALNAKVSA